MDLRIITRHECDVMYYQHFGKYYPPEITAAEAGQDVLEDLGYPKFLEFHTKIRTWIETIKTSLSQYSWPREM